MAMDLRLSDLQELIRDSADDFLEREAPASRMRQIEWAGEPDDELWSQLVELGWTGLPIAEEHGGQGAQLVDLGVLIEQLCRHALLSPYQQTMLAAATVQRHGDAALQASLLPRIVAGATCAPALAEGNGGLFGAIATTTDGATLSGSKRYVEFGASSDLHLVAATREGEPGLALVAREQPGVSTRALTGIGLTPQAEVSYDGASVEGWIGRRRGGRLPARAGLGDLLAGVLRARTEGARHDRQLRPGARRLRAADRDVRGGTGPRRGRRGRRHRLALPRLRAALQAGPGRAGRAARREGEVGRLALGGGRKPTGDTCCTAAWASWRSTTCNSTRAAARKHRCAGATHASRSARWRRRCSASRQANAEDEPWRRCWIRSRAKRSTRTR